MDSQAPSPIGSKEGSERGSYVSHESRGFRQRSTQTYSLPRSPTPPSAASRQARAQQDDEAQPHPDPSGSQWSGVPHPEDAGAGQILDRRYFAEEDLPEVHAAPFSSGSKRSYGVSTDPQSGGYEGRGLAESDLPAAAEHGNYNSQADYNNGNYNSGDYNNGAYNNGDYNNGDDDPSFPESEVPRAAKRSRVDSEAARSSGSGKPAARPFRYNNESFVQSDSGSEGLRYRDSSEARPPSPGTPLLTARQDAGDFGNMSLMKQWDAPEPQRGAAAYRAAPQPNDDDITEHMMIRGTRPTGNDRTNLYSSDPPSQVPYADYILHTFTFRTPAERYTQVLIWCLRRRMAQIELEMPRGHDRAFQEKILEVLTTVINNLDSQTITVRWDPYQLLDLQPPLPNPTNERADRVIRLISDARRAYARFNVETWRYYENRTERIELELGNGHLAPAGEAAAGEAGERRLGEETTPSEERHRNEGKQGEAQTGEGEKVKPREKYSFEKRTDEAFALFDSLKKLMKQRAAKSKALLEGAPTMLARRKEANSSLAPGSIEPLDYDASLDLPITASRSVKATTQDAGPNDQPPNDEPPNG